MSATEMSKAVTVGPQTVNHNLKALSEAHALCIRTVRLEGNAKEDRHCSLVSANPTLHSVLTETGAFLHLAGRSSKSRSLSVES